MALMNEIVVSKFCTWYYFKGMCGGIILSLVTGFMIRLLVAGNLANPGEAYFLTAFFTGALCFYFYFFSKSWKRITVTPEAIIVYDIVFKKQLTISYPNITRIGTYRRPGYSQRSGLAYSQHFVIEVNDDRSFTIDEAFYDNYSQLTMAIYLHKYGPGHGRERYLEGRGR
jgi:hypothetical protein